MAKRKKTDFGPQRHAEGQHGEKTHRRFVQALQESAPREELTEQPAIEGRHRLRQARQQHDEAEKNSETVAAMREIQRGQADESVLDHARIPHEGDSR